MVTFFLTGSLLSLCTKGSESSVNEGKYRGVLQSVSPWEVHFLMLAWILGGTLWALGIGGGSCAMYHHAIIATQHPGGYTS